MVFDIYSLIHLRNRFTRKYCDTSTTKVNDRALPSTCYNALPQDHDVVTDNEVGTSIFAIFEHLKESESEGKGAVVRISQNDKGAGGGGGNLVKTSALKSVEQTLSKCSPIFSRNKQKISKPNISLSSPSFSFPSPKRFNGENNIKDLGHIIDFSKWGI